MKFVKMHGLGNDFIMADGMKGEYDGFDFASFAKKNCDRRFGVGADGVLALEKSEKADARMRLTNPDGSEAEMCGNGIRCAARLLIDSKRARSPVKIETAAGIMTIAETNGKYRVDMGVPRIPEKEFELDLGGKKLRATFVDMGNPHVVVFVENFDFDWKSLGRRIENHGRFPDRTNAEFARIVSEDLIEVRVWERGAGATLACGTGACAVLAAAAENEKAGNKCKVKLPGGILEIEKSGGRIFMTGPAEYAFEGRTF